MSKTTIALAFAAGLLGGLASRYLSPQPVHAQTLAAEIRAQRFVLVNEQGVVLGTLSEQTGRAALRLFDTNGQEVWSAGGSLGRHAGSLGK